MAIEHLLFIIAFVLGVGLASVWVLARRLLIRVGEDEALVVNTMDATLVSFRDRIVMPIVHRAEKMDLSLQPVTLVRSGTEGVFCKDSIRADVSIQVVVGVNRTEEDILRVAQSIGCKRASDPNTVRDLFMARFSEALKSVASRQGFVELYVQRAAFRDAFIEEIGVNLGGYIIDSAEITHFTYTPVDALDPRNILDAKSLKRVGPLHEALLALKANDDEALAEMDDDIVWMATEMRRFDAEGVVRGCNLGIERADVIDIAQILPEPEELEANPVDWLETDGDLLRIHMNSTSNVFALETAFAANLGVTPSGHFTVTIRQMHGADVVQVHIATPLTSLPEAARSTAARLPELALGDMVSCDWETMRRLLARLRFVMQANDNERWG